MLELQQEFWLGFPSVLRPMSLLLLLLLLQC
jgi:hypothetical protein